jgi:serine/threonine-protein kinase
MPLHLDAGFAPIAGYTLVRLLGRGGFGEVWEAMAPGGVRVALKFIRLDTDEAGAEQRALDIIRDIRHPHLLDVQFATRVEDCLVIAMPLCDQSLMDRLRACQAEGLPGLPRDELLDFMNDLARAIDFLNEPRHRGEGGGPVGVQHRDIKPHNIFLVGGAVRLADFGLAKILEASSATHTGSMSPSYVAPEVLEGRVSQWSDQYSLAVSYVQLRTGRLPFAGSTINQVLYAHLNTPPDLSVLPAEESRVLARALAKKPEERWPTCRAFVLALTEAARHHDGRLAPASGSTTTVTATEVAERTRLPDTEASPPIAHTLVDAGGQAAVEAMATALPPQPRRCRLRHAALAGLAAGLAGLAFALLIPRSGPNRPIDRNPAREVEVARSKAAGTLPAVVAKAQVPEHPTAFEPTPNRSPIVPFPKESPAVEPPGVPAKDTPPPREVVPEPDPELARHARAILKTYCYRCHGVRVEVPGYDVLDRDVLIARRDEDEPQYVVPGKPAASFLWERIGVEKDMPPSGPAPSDEERALIARWIEAGAPFPQVDRATRPLRTERDVLSSIRDHLRQARPGDRVFLRYFALHTLLNDKSNDDARLSLARAAVAKLVNSLSREPKIVVPQAVDREQVVLAIDLRDVGWAKRDLWSEILQRYPYGLKHDRDPEAEVRTVAADVEAMAGTPLPFVRADWFVATASRPPLYPILLDLPRDDRTLEHQLEVDVAADFLDDQLARGGFAGRGLVSQHRLVERHPTLQGAYWKSYDFPKDEPTADLYRFPLGPIFADNPYPDQAFVHAANGLLFNLPNGLQGYMIVDSKGRRLDAGPVAVVGDPLKTAGTAAVVPGLSCMACHRLGIIPFQDDVRDGLAIAGAARDKAVRLYPPQEAMDKLLARDESRFLKALDAAAGAFLKVGEDRTKTIREFPEPIGAVARAYFKDLGPDAVAADLGLGDPKELTRLLKTSTRLRESALAPLVRDATITRTEWDSLDGRFLSRFQEVARELELGTPFRSF